MRPLVLALALLLAGAAVAPRVTVAAQAGDMAGLAPADRYFGQLRMSILGIRNRIAELSRRAGADPDARRFVHDARLVENALRDWHAQYPRDPWIPRLSYALGELYGKLGRPELAEALPGR